MDEDKRLREAFPAGILAWIVLMLCIFYAPRQGGYVLDLPETEAVSINCRLSGDVFASVEDHKTEDEQAMAQFIALLRELRVRLVRDGGIYRKGEVSADVSVCFADGSACCFVLFDNGIVRCGEKDYSCYNKEVLQQLMEIICDWETSG